MPRNSVRLLLRTPTVAHHPSATSLERLPQKSDADSSARKPVFSDTDPHSAASELRDREIEESALLVPIVPPEDRDSSGPSSPARPPLLKASSFSDLPTYKQGIIEIRFPKARHSLTLTHRRMSKRTLMHITHLDWRAISDDAGR